MLTVDDALDALETKRVVYAYCKRSLSLPLTQALFSSAGVDSGTHQLLSLIAQETDGARYDAVTDVGCGAGTLAIALASRPAGERPSVVVASDRDALATAWTARSAALNGLDHITTVCALGVPPMPIATGAPRLSVCNIPAKAGHPVIERLIAALIGGGNADDRDRPTDGSQAAFVIVTPLASLLRAAIERLGATVVSERSSANHVSVIVGTRAADHVEPADDALPEAYTRGISEFPGPVRPYRAQTVFGLPEFDGLAYRTALGFDLLRGLEIGGRVGVYGVGQGHLPVAVVQSGDRITECLLFDRDLLALRVARANLARNGYLDAASHPVATPCALVDAGTDEPFNWLVVNDDPVPGSIWNSEIVSVADSALADDGKIIVVSRTTSLNRLERDAGRLLRVIDERRMHGYCARLYRRRR